MTDRIGRRDFLALATSAPLMALSPKPGRIFACVNEVSSANVDFRLAMEGYAHIGAAERQAIHQRVWQRRAFATGSVA